MVLVGLGPDHPLDGEAGVDQVPIGRDVDVLQVVEQGRALVPRHRQRALDDVVAMERRDGDELDVMHVQLGCPARELGLDALEHLLAVAHEIHLVDGHDEMRDAQERRDERMAPRLLQHAVAGVDEDDREVRGGCAGHHVARVLDVAGGVRDDELASGRGEVPVRHVDGMNARFMGRSIYIDSHNYNTR